MSQTQKDDCSSVKEFQDYENNFSLRENSQNFRGNPGKKVDCFVARIAIAPRNDGFTLAEVLITLVIIGVIAAITVPTLITKYQKEQTVTRLKKAYSALAQTTNRAIADNGPIKNWETNVSASVFFEKYLKPYLAISKDCKLKTTDECVFKYSYLNNNTQGGVLDSNHYRFFLQDGTLVAIVVWEDKIAIHVDINGLKKPNKFGRDVFRFDYFINNSYYPSENGKFIPAGNFSNQLSITSDCACNKNSASRAGLCCASVIMRYNWTIPDLYPW